MAHKAGTTLSRRDCSEKTRQNVLSGGCVCTNKQGRGHEVRQCLVSSYRQGERRRNFSDKIVVFRSGVKKEEKEALDSSSYVVEGSRGFGFLFHD
jgi:hypothetical protein